jgi:hypothetical protein
MLGWRSLNLELTPLDPNLERNIRRKCRAHVEMGDHQRNANVEEREEYQDARAGNGEQRRAYDMDFTTSLRELFAPVATSSHSCIVLPPTNATHYDLKPHVIQMLPSFYNLDHETHIPMSRSSKISVPPPNSKISLRKLFTLYFFRSLFMIELWSGWIPTLLGLLHPGNNC